MSVTRASAPAELAGPTQPAGPEQPRVRVLARAALSQMAFSAGASVALALLLLLLAYGLGR